VNINQPHDEHFGDFSSFALRMRKIRAYFWQHVTLGSPSTTDIYNVKTDPIILPSIRPPDGQGERAERPSSVSRPKQKYP
jgi:hypothetical protein